MSRFHPAVLAGALWAGASAWLVKRRLRRYGLQARVPPPPRVGWRGGRGVRAALRHLSPTCLERALVEQAWLAYRGAPRDVVIGVPPGGMKGAVAHAWLDGTDPAAANDYVELHRLPPPVRRK